MKLFKYFKPKYRHKNPKVRIDSIPDIKNVKTLIRIYKNDPDKNVRLKAERSLFEISIIGKSTNHGILAIDNISSHDLLLKIATDSKSQILKERAYSKLTGNEMTLTVEEAYGKGSEYFKKDDYSMAILHFKNALDKDTENAVLNFALGMTYSKITIPAKSDEQLQINIDKMCSYFYNAIKCNDKNGGLSKNQYKLACMSLGGIYKVQKRYDKAIKIFQKALKCDPLDISFQEGLALCLIEEGQLDKAEKTVENILKNNPNYTRCRKLWKNIRKLSNKPITVNLSNSLKKEIYSKYYADIDKYFLSDTKMYEKIQNNGKSLNGIKKIMDNSSGIAGEKVDKDIISSYGITKFQLSQIIHEGKRLNWEIETLVNLDHITREQNRDALICTYCGKRNFAGYWPIDGDNIGFYFQSAERTKEIPGAFRLPIFCQFCLKTWYVVWDSNPDPIAYHFISNLESVGIKYKKKPGAVRFFYSLISDEIIGKHIAFFKDNFKIVHEMKTVAEHKFRIQDNFCALTMVPEIKPLSILRQFKCNYINYFSNLFDSNEFRDITGIHWIVGFNNEAVIVHIAIFPKDLLKSKIPIIFPIDLLNDNEKTLIGIS